jgi:8-amino-7-oxononanoate synthase
VLHLAQLLRTRLHVEGASQIIPVMLGANDRALRIATQLQQAGFDVRAIRPPSVPPDTARLRISINAMLDGAVLHSFADALAAALEESTCAASS